MGWDVAGWVELYRYDRWGGTIVISEVVVDRNYAMFDCLFGVMSFSRFRPIVGIRGLPTDISVEAKRSFDTEGLDEDPDYTLPEGYDSYPTWISWEEIEAIDWSERAEEPDVRTGQVRERSEARSPEWDTLFEMMRILAAHFGKENVRLVIWFNH